LKPRVEMRVPLLDQKQMQVCFGFLREAGVGHVRDSEPAGRPGPSECPSFEVEVRSVLN
jgi:hypothetical protein